MARALPCLIVAGWLGGGCTDEALPFDVNRDFGAAPHPVAADLSPSPGMGGPVPFGAPAMIAMDSGAGNLVAGDFNGDGRRDLAYCNRNTGKVHPLFGNGDGTFKAGAVLPVACTWGRLYSFDIDRDGKWDLLAGQTLARGSANGSFVPITVSSTVVPADVDGDGHLDLADYVSTMGGAPEVHYFRYSNGGFQDAGPACTSNPGDRRCVRDLGPRRGGGFHCLINGVKLRLVAAGRPGKPLESLDEGTSVSDYTGALQLLDDDLDGQPDWTGWPSTFPGVGTYLVTYQLAREALPVASASSASVVSADINGDTVADRIATSGMENDVVLLYRGRVDAPTQRLPFGVPGTGNGVAVGDFNSDGRLDIAVSFSNDSPPSGGVLVFLRT